MKQRNQRIIAVLLLVCLLVSGCGQSPTTASNSTTPEEEHPAKIEHLEGKDQPTREVLTEDAVKRLAIQTDKVQEVQANGATRRAIPYGALLYDTQGDTWVYVNSEPLTFVRTRIVVDSIDTANVFLSEGPAVGAAVVTVGATELYGAEIEFQEE